MQASPDFLARMRLPAQPQAHPKSTVQAGHARFTILTPRLLRLEWSETGSFEDRGSLAFPHRYALPPLFTTTIEQGVTTIATDALLLRYRHDVGPFTAQNLEITLRAASTPHTWRPGQPNPGNLRGTASTLDLADGPVGMGDGLLSRDGWALVDDSRSVLLDAEHGWVEPRPDTTGQDWYFFGYGHDYTAALADYMRFGGQTPLIPRFVLGAWWSRFWAYSDAELRELVAAFRAHDFPLDVLVLDMDWHTPGTWTGYTWNHELFPDPPAFLRWVHEQGMQATLNLHPADGVQAFEAAYPAFAQAMGIAPESGETIPFRASDPAFMQYYFELLHHPMEEQGVDFWWIDWQQGESSEMPGLNPLSWLNHLHFQDAARRGKRPLLYSRYGGLGGHRYPIGFSGDTLARWDVLRFLPYFTATAANVGFGWWSHDIGGHIGVDEPELYARWVQFGALSPCLRLHATKDVTAERRPWAFPPAVAAAAQEAFHLRYQLIPYLYTMARVAAETGVALCRPVYYAYPEVEDAYLCRQQYFLGDDLIAAPIIRPGDPETGLATVEVWIPPGEWIEWTTKETFHGPCWALLAGDLSRIPLLARAGAIIPLAASLTNTSSQQDALSVRILPGQSGSARLYVDDGTTLAYQSGASTWTTFTMHCPDPTRCVITMATDAGHTHLPEMQRPEIELQLEGALCPERITLNGALFVNWTYDAEQLRVRVTIPSTAEDQQIRVEVQAAKGIFGVGIAHNQSVARADLSALGIDRQVAWEQLPALADSLVGEARRVALAKIGGPFPSVMDYPIAADASNQFSHLVLAAPTDGSTYSAEGTWRLEGQKGTETHGFQIAETDEAQVLACPFAYEGHAHPMRWSVEGVLRWRGLALPFKEVGPLLCASVPGWRLLPYELETGLDWGLSRMFDQAGRPNAEFAWEPLSQEDNAQVNLAEPFRVDLAQSFAARYSDDHALGCYAWARVICPDARQAVIRFQRWGDGQRLYVNGQDVSQKEMSSEDTTGFDPLYVHTTQPISLHAGVNDLVIETRGRVRQWWFFSALFTTLSGDPMTDLTYAPL
ncbi:MAG TPA: TIM-barrel domain-containing protein [Ktedonobacterales bacterium]|nr:TIM-barrel domain-containing protein [Ktedonobacterales bacterium]